VLSQRRIEPEVMDSLPPEEARPNLADLVQINRRFGGHSTLLRTLKTTVPPKASFSLLDVGAASGDSARVIREHYPLAAVTSLDHNATNIEQAPRPKLLADAFHLPFTERSFDYVLCSLFLHHFEDRQVITLMKGIYQVARRGVFILDLERHILPWLFLPATRFLFRWNEVTVSDGVKSVRASFRRRELQQFAEAAGMANVKVQVFRPAFRLALTAVK